MGLPEPNRVRASFSPRVGWGTRYDSGPLASLQALLDIPASRSGDLRLWTGMDTTLAGIEHRTSLYVHALGGLEYQGWRRHELGLQASWAAARVHMPEYSLGGDTRTALPVLTLQWKWFFAGS